MKINFVSRQASLTARQRVTKNTQAKSSSLQWEKAGTTTRIPELLRLEEISGDHLVQHPAQAGSARAGCPGPLSSQVLSISTGGNSTTSLGNLCQCFITLTVEKCCLVFRRNLLCFSLCPLPPVPSQDTTENSPAPSSFPPIRCLHTGIAPLSCLFQAEQSHLSQLPLTERCFGPLIIFSALL